MFNALVVEDDQKLCITYCDFLQKQGYRAVAAHDAIEALDAMKANYIDIALCDIMMSDIDGVSLIDALRKRNPDLPVIILTELNDLRSKQRAFSAGCDDYMVKPIDLNELSMRMTAVLRRSHSISQKQIIIGDALLDSNALNVSEGPFSVTLPPKEFMLLFKLCASPGRIFTRQDIMADIWGTDSQSDERTVDAHVKKLRKRFASSSSFRIDTIRGVGYRAIELRPA